MKMKMTAGVEKRIKEENDREVESWARSRTTGP